MKCYRAWHWSDVVSVLAALALWACMANLLVVGLVVLLAVLRVSIAFFELVLCE
jgi:hypothetical protein